MADTIFMGVQGPETATLDALLQEAADILGVPRQNVVLVDDVGQGVACFNADMPDGYYDDHPDGESMRDGDFTVSWEPA